MTQDLRGHNVYQEYDHANGDHKPTEESNVGLSQLVSGFIIRKHLKLQSTSHQ